MRCMACRIIATRSSGFRTKSLYEDGVNADQVHPIARQSLNIWLGQLALINPLVEPAMPDSQFACQAWNGPEPINHGDLAVSMQGTDLAVVLPQFVNGANRDSQSAS